MLKVDEPIIITGKGGSGTRLLSRMIQQSQIFLGNRLNRQGDSLEWVKLNRKYLFEGIKLKNNTFTAKHKTEVIGLAETILNDLPDKTPYKCWGFKLPEMLFLLPELFDTFENAKLVHLIRHPVKGSMRRTHITSRLDNPVGQWALPRAYQYLNNNDYDINRESDAINNAICWKHQVDIINDFTESHLSSNQFITVRFEDMIANPEVVQKQLLNFIGVDAPNKLNLEIDPQRVNENIGHDLDTADKIWGLCAETARKYGYQSQ